VNSFKAFTGPHLATNPRTVRQTGLWWECSGVGNVCMCVCLDSGV
jgi:hypothetical protein